MAAQHRADASAALFDHLPHAPHVSDIRALLFDLGGVLVELDWSRVFEHWARHGGSEADALRGRFAFDEPYQRHERGEISAAQYYEALRRSLALGDLADEEIERGWNALFVRVIPETLEMVKSLQGRIPLYLFSNTNAVHHAAWSSRFAQALEPFDRMFISSTMGLRKPSRESFEHVARAIGVPVGSILFLDDTLENIEGAKAAGMPAVLVRSPDDVREAVRPWLPAT
jgi:glucose-1-phosphatase